jgi:hypothetical protein
MVSPPNCMLPRGLLFSFSTDQDVTDLFVQAVKALCSVSVVTRPIILLLLIPCSTYLTCALLDSLWCLLSAWTLWPTRQGSCRYECQSCSRARTFRFRSSCRHWRLHLPSSRCFILVTSRVGQCSLQQIECCGTVSAAVAVLFLIRPERRSTSCFSACHTRTLVTREAGVCLYTLYCPSHRCTFVCALPSLRRSSPYVILTAWSPTYWTIIRGRISDVLAFVPANGLCT